MNIASTTFLLSRVFSRLLPIYVAKARESAAAGAAGAQTTSVPTIGKEQNFLFRAHRFLATIWDRWATHWSVHTRFFLQLFLSIQIGTIGYALECIQRECSTIVLPRFFLYN